MKPSPLPSTYQHGLLAGNNRKGPQIFSGRKSCKEKPALLKLQGLFAKPVIAQIQQTWGVQVSCPLCSARPRLREAQALAKPPSSSGVESPPEPHSALP